MPPSSRCLAQAGGQAKQAAAAFDMYVMLFQAAEKEVASFGLGVERDAQGVVRLSKRARLVPGGNWAGFVAGAKPSKQNVLAGLPDGPFVFAGGGSLSEATMGKLMDFSFGLMKNMHEMYGLSEEQAKMFSELGKEKFPRRPRLFLRARRGPKRRTDLFADVGHHAGEQQRDIPGRLREVPRTL